MNILKIVFRGGMEEVTIVSHTEGDKNCQWYGERDEGGWSRGVKGGWIDIRRRFSPPPCLSHPLPSSARCHYEDILLTGVQKIWLHKMVETKWRIFPIVSSLSRCVCVRVKGINFILICEWENWTLKRGF